jgi:DNA-directed RNA polymerase specialized sigma24 family protein
VLLLSAWEGLSHREIAEVIGCSQAAVDKRMVRAKKRLAKQYEAMNESNALSPGATSKGDDS